MGNAKEQRKPLPIAKFLSRSTSYGHLSYIFNFSFFLIGLTLGITAVFCFQSFDIMSQISTTSDILLSSNLFALQPPPLPSLPQPPPPPPPPPTTYNSQVHWGKSTMTDAERRLIASALLDLSNERFVLLSEACIPLFNFTNTYNYLINTKLNFVQLFDDPGREGQGRYSSEMSPQISLSNWRKGSQWFASNRKLAVEIVSDSKYYPIFQKYCNPPCYADEHYIPTLINILFPEANSNRSITWVDWSKGGKAHPGTFGKKNVSEEILDKIRFGTNCTYIDSGGNMKSTSLCFLFARKFLPETSQQLLRIAPWYVLLNNTGA
ncbi:hypothetical protein CsatB_017168 [Cannabis sativa]